MITKIKTSRNFLFDPVATEVISVNVLGNPSFEALKASIENAVLNFEVLNSRVLNDADGGYYFVPNESIKKPYIEIREAGQSREDFVNEQSSKMFDLEKGEFQRFILVPNDGYIEMTIVQHHIAGDGSSIMLLVRKIMENLEKIDSQNGSLELEIPEMQPMKPFTLKDIQEHVQLNDLLKMTIDEFNNKWEEEKVLFTNEDRKRLYEEHWNNTHVNVHASVVSPDKMENILKACRSHNITVNSLIYALAARAFEETVKMGFVVNCRTPKFTSYGNYANSLVFDGSYDETKNFWENAQAIHNIMSCQVVDLSAPMMGSMMMNTVEGTLLDASNFRNRAGFKSKVVDDYAKALGLGDDKITFLSSNMGNLSIPYQYGKYAIDSILIGSPLDPCLRCNIGIITVNGKMTMNAEYVDVDGIDFEYILSELENGLNLLGMGEEIQEESYSNVRELQVV